MKKQEWYAADFETNNINNKEAEVWAAGIKNINKEDFAAFSDFKTFFNYISIYVENEASIWFHNLKFDGTFIICELLKYGYKITDSPLSKMNVGEIKTMISGLGQWYMISIKINKHKLIHIKNSVNKMPFKLAEIAKQLNLEVQKQEIDYTIYRKPGEPLTSKDYSYLKADVDILAESLKQLYYNEGYTSLTIGSDCIKEFKSMTPSFESLFPNIDSLFNDLYKYYKGGLCIINKKHIQKGVVLDINSMYPYVMHSISNNMFPIGCPVHFEGIYEADNDYPLYLQHIKANFEIKEGMIPYLQTDELSYYNNGDFLTTSDGEMIDLYLTDTDLEIFFTNYEVFEVRYIDGYKFEGRIGIFDKYINKWYELKKQSRPGSVDRMRAKLFLNNLGGKFGTSVKNKKYNIKGLNDGVLKMEQEDSIRKGIYIPVAIFMTSYARTKLIKAINANYKYFAYCDTDSIHLECDINEVKEVEIDNTKLGAWKIESEFEEGIYLKQKAYAEKTNGEWVYKVSGMGEDLKKQMKIEDFKQGFTTEGTSYSGTLRTQRVKGGVILKSVPFSII